MPEKQKYKGIIKFFSFRKGYGFIMPEDLGLKEDVFFHFSSISHLPGMVVYLLPNEKIEFDLEQGPRGYLAKNVTSKIRIRDKKFDKKVSNIYYHYYYSFKKIVDITVENEISKQKCLRK